MTIPLQHISPCRILHNYDYLLKFPPDEDARVTVVMVVVLKLNIFVVLKRKGKEELGRRMM